MFNRNTKIVVVAAVATVVAVITGNFAANKIHTDDDLARIAASIPPRDAGPPGLPPPIEDQPNVDSFDPNPFARRWGGKLVPNATQTKTVEQVKLSDGPYRTISDLAFLLAKVIPCLAIFVLWESYQDKQRIDTNILPEGGELHESPTDTRCSVSDGGSHPADGEGLPVRTGTPSGV